MGSMENTLRYVYVHVSDAERRKPPMKRSLLALDGATLQQFHAAYLANHALKAEIASSDSTAE